MKNRRTAKYYVVDGKVLSSGDLRRLHRYMIEVESISVISQTVVVPTATWSVGSTSSCRRQIVRLILTG